MTIFGIVLEKSAWQESDNAAHKLLRKSEALLTKSTRMKVAQVEVTTWIESGHLRFASFPSNDLGSGVPALAQEP